MWGFAVQRPETNPSIYASVSKNNAYQRILSQKVALGFGKTYGWPPVYPHSSLSAFS
jgi:hypothetical protein